ncbi:ABC transporter permease [Agreia pratensis]|uniref:ABC transporter permease n=1 Tax=Agreia pratensis TaxID=150121 RepID=UPI00188D6557|nr:ABC transporter permease [Agreia pratensis]MBF4636283.1 ABC transporter permease [Agreia pratensis]
MNRSRLLAADLLRVGAVGIRFRPLRAVLAALGIAVGIAAMIAVIGISSTSQARLGKQLDLLGTNLLTAGSAASPGAEPVTLAPNAVERVLRIDGVEAASATAYLPATNIYRNAFVDPNRTKGIMVSVADGRLIDVTHSALGKGRWFDSATETLPSVVLGAQAARLLGIDTIGDLVWLGGIDFTVIGILEPSPLAPELDMNALVARPIATSKLGWNGHPSTVYERSSNSAVQHVQALIAASIDPAHPRHVGVTRPSDALQARSAVDTSFTGLILGIGSVALLVGGIGVANTMVISVLERRREIGLRRALGATRGHIRVQFLMEAFLLSLLGGLGGTGLGIIAVAGFATLNDAPFTVPLAIILTGIGSTIAIGVLAGLYPAVSAARTPPAIALTT